MDKLRDQAEKTSVWNDDMYAWIMPYSIDRHDEVYWTVDDDSGYLYLEWYKSRGKTDKCIDMDTIEPLSLDKAYEICLFIKKVIW